VRSATRLSLLLALVLSMQAGAGNIQSASVDYKAGVYSLSFNVVIDAELDSVRAIVTDYARFDQLSEMVIESALLDTPHADQERRLLVIRPCILVFCRDLRMVEDVTVEGHDRIATTVVPDQSDFKSGKTHWQLTGVDRQHTRIEFYGYEEPGFWIPPLFGPVLVQRRLLKEAMTIITNIEHLSRNG